MKKIICKDFHELSEACWKHNEEHNVTQQYGDKHPLKCFVRFKQMPDWNREFNELERTYEFSSSNKAFIAGMGGNSIFAHCLGYEEDIRLDNYLNEWDIEECWYEVEEYLGMKLVELLSITSSNHFALKVVGETNERRYKIIDYRGHEYDDCEVLNIDCTTEVEQPSLITHSVSVRPILLITIRR